MISELLGAAQSVQALSSLLQAAKTLSNYNEIVAAVSQVNAKLMQANAVALASQEKQAALAARVAELEKDIERMSEWDRQAVRYVLTALAPGVFVYALRPDRAEEGEPMHYLCANCMGKRQTALIQLAAESSFGRKYECHNCGAVLTVELAKPAESCMVISDYDPLERKGAW
jgi:DNA-directed RNA polymerase subunit RPC12/RpoP